MIKRADKRSCVVIWHKNGYDKEAEIQLNNQIVYKYIKFKDERLTELVEKSNQFFKSVKGSGTISEKDLQYFICKYKKQLVLVKCI